MNKWQEKTIANLMRRGYDSYTASKIYDRAYTRVGSIISKGFNREFETFMSIASDTNFVNFDIKGNRLYYTDTGEDVKSETFERRYTTDRLREFAKKHIDVQRKLDEYILGKITLQELNDYVAEFKKTNQEYLKEGSK